ncbi:beta-glucosidase [Sphingobium sp. CR2-8]|uniref:beta-glucosidase family protein n=1 Tax=Sphingobium sp. CR2-8 TaxID=1306534 RepID=UPI002DC05A89|nr:beta-glucosidase [Sphingobium sp. CR2-8]MEC3909490.1 beta-glucosidase [Sphingobium sp. CR2-8]
MKTAIATVNMPLSISALSHALGLPCRRTGDIPFFLRMTTLTKSKIRNNGTNDTRRIFTMTSVSGISKFMNRRVRTLALSGVATIILLGSAMAVGASKAQSRQPRGSRPWQNGLLSPDERAEMVVRAMTQEEKFAWLSGPMAIPIGEMKKPDGAIGSAAFYPAIARLGIPAQQQADASLGVGNLGDVRPGDNATALPSSLLLGASFDPAMAYETGALVGQEARAKGFNVQLAGGANLIREPRGGRNFEYISEDPLLTGMIAGNSVAGIQSQGIVSTVKHFAVNPQETGRVLVSSDLEKSALHESDLLAFQLAIEIGKPGAVMPGYNLVNGEWASENDYLLNTVLKGEWHYPGWVMSDWGATHSTEKAALAGLDVQSGANLDPTAFFGAPLLTAVKEGRVPQSRIDDMVRRQLRSLFAVGAIDRPATPGADIDYAAHRLIAQRSAERGIVLLKNEGDILPAAKGAKRILVIGRHADAGVLSGGGSASVSPVGSLVVDGVGGMGVAMPKIYHPSSPLKAIKAESNAAEVNFADGVDIADATAKAAEADVVFLFAEEWRTEGQDRPDLSLADEQDALIDAVVDANPHTVVILQSGGPVLMPWLAKVPAVLAAFYPGSGGGEAIAGILFGRVNPSGRLPVTFPADIDNLPHPMQRDPKTTTSNPGSPIKGGVFHMDYNVEGSDVGYRWYAREKVQPLFPFGHGLSFTRFDYEELSTRVERGTIIASVTVHNKGDRMGADVPQLYVERPGTGGFVPRLGAFERVELKPGESRRLEMRVDPRLLSRFDAGQRRWIVSQGRYVVRVAPDAMAAGLHRDVQLPGHILPP